jgi:hypothetical protein
VAAPEDCRRDEKTRDELKLWMDYEVERRFGPSRIDEAELHKRFLMTQELVREHGMEWEPARRKVMVQRTREQHPEITMWPELGNSA